jgi:hypothetical protein
MSAKSDAKKEFAKEIELKKLRAKHVANKAEKPTMAIKVANACIAASVVFFGFMITLALVQDSPNADSIRKAKVANITGIVHFISVINPATVNVVFDITNANDSAKTPTCSVSVSDPGSAYTGFALPDFTIPLAAGQTQTNNINITVTNQGAQYVTEGSVTCF